MARPRPCGQIEVLQERASRATHACISVIVIAAVVSCTVVVHLRVFCGQCCVSEHQGIMIRSRDASKHQGMNLPGKPLTVTAVQSVPRRRHVDLLQLIIVCCCKTTFSSASFSLQARHVCNQKISAPVSSLDVVPGTSAHCTNAHAPRKAIEMQI